MTLKNYIENNKNKYSFLNSNVLLNLIEELQKILEFAFAIEDLDERLIPKLSLGESKEESKISETIEYEKPMIYISLSKRAYTGVGLASNNDMFKGSIASAKPKFEKSSDGENYQISKALVRTENELLLTLKTKTVKEQLTLLNLLERALNIYCGTIMANFINFCAIYKIETVEKKDSNDLHTAKIYFHVKLHEELEKDDTYILSAFSIYNGGNVFVNSEKEDEIDKEEEAYNNIMAMDIIE